MVQCSRVIHRISTGTHAHTHCEFFKSGLDGLDEIEQTLNGLGLWARDGLEMG